MTGGRFSIAIAGVLGAAGMWGLGDRTVLYALVALCVIAALTMFTAAFDGSVQIAAVMAGSRWDRGGVSGASGA
ncbi:hypothetical protein [Winogradskya humida]|uniref:hypothetical protein n=1 Tax=Winogradskya humida TaxID=113566 RepID=UPI001942BE50|nr:hypothetical protein [Actinoplanes humidus]